MSVNLQQLREKLGKGFYVDNLYAMARLCRNLALETNNPASFFIMEQIFNGIANYWEDKPITVEEAKLVETEIMQPVNNLLDGIEANASKAQIIDLLNEVVSAYMFLFK